MPIVQLFINYKLKSVAHLPWRMMTYRALRSFIDDVAASVTKRPSRSCLRGRLRGNKEMLSFIPLLPPFKILYLHSLQKKYIQNISLDIIFIVFLYQRWIYRVVLVAMVVITT